MTEGRFRGLFFRLLAAIVEAASSRHSKNAFYIPKRNC